MMGRIPGRGDDSSQSGPPPGWHPDPWEQEPERWWDGYQWTQHTRQPQAGSSRTRPVLAIVMIAVVLGSCMAIVGSDDDDPGADSEANDEDLDPDEYAAEACAEAEDASDTNAAIASLATAASASTRLGYDREEVEDAIDDQCRDDLRDVHEKERQERRAYDPDEDDFDLTVNVLEKSCFGSAGCNVRFRIAVDYSGPRPLDPSKTYEVTYEVRGGDDVRINTLTVEGKQYATDDRESVSTSSSDAELEAVVINVGERGR